LSFLSATTDIILPVAGFITALFAGWVVSTSTAREAIGFESDKWFQRWRFLIRYVCPIGIGAVIIYGIIIAPWLASIETKRACEAAQIEMNAGGATEELQAVLARCQ